MDERSALTLSSLPNKQAFIDAWEAGDQTFPIMASVKVVRTMDQLGGASQPANAEAKRSAKFGLRTMQSCCGVVLAQAIPSQASAVSLSARCCGTMTNAASASGASEPGA